MAAARAVSQADSLRDRKDWSGAARLYRRALAWQPGRRAIWVQLGHCLKEAGDDQGALDAYLRATSVEAEGECDVWLHLGHLARHLGRTDLAYRAFKHRLDEYPSNRESFEQLVSLANDHRCWAPDLERAVDQAVSDDLSRSAGASEPDARKILADVTDLLKDFRPGRPPSGIQRVQLELTPALVQLSPAAGVAMYVANRGGWVHVPTVVVAKLQQASRRDDQHDFHDSLFLVQTIAYLRSRGKVLAFARGDVLLSIGSSWDDRSYGMAVRHLVNSVGVRYVPFIHDLIPALYPSLCAAKVPEHFVDWLYEASACASLMVANSENTKLDLLKCLEVRGHQAPPVAVIPLDVNFTVNSAVDRAQELRPGWDLAKRQYVLYVSTLEVRKNHLIAFQTWLRLLRERGRNSDVPKLVCVGRAGWGSEDALFFLRENPELNEYVKIIHDVRDDDLSCLYENCLFTIYISSYEGWGLPVTESLCHGKVPLVSRVASLPEAGRGFAEFIDKVDVESLYRKIVDLVGTPARLQKLEARISNQFRPGDWDQMARRMLDAIDHACAPPTQLARATPKIQMGTLLRFPNTRQLALAPRPLLPSSIFVGTGWLDWPGVGMGVQQCGGDLEFRPQGQALAVRCTLLLVDVDNSGQTVTITSGSRSYRFHVPAGTRRFISFVTPVVEGIVRIRIEVQDLTGAGSSGNVPQAGLAISGMLVSDEHDLSMQRALRRLVASGRVDDYAFVKAVWFLARGRDPDIEELDFFLPSLASGTLERQSVIEIAFECAEGRHVRRTEFVFD